MVTGVPRAASLPGRGPVALVFGEAREHAAVAGADLLGVALRDELRAPRRAREERGALRHQLRLLAERARDVNVRERLGDALGVQHERQGLLVARLATAAQQRHAARAGETGGEAAQRPEQRRPRRREVAPSVAVELRTRERRTRPAREQALRSPQQRAHEVAHRHERLDLRGALVDRGDERVTHVALDVVLGHDAVAAEDLQRTAAGVHRLLRAVPLHQWRELAQPPRRALVGAVHDRVLQRRGLDHERATTGDRRLHLHQHLGDHRVLADRPTHLDAPRGVVLRRGERGLRDAEALDADADARLVHETRDAAPALADLPEWHRARALEHERARGGAADRELVLRALDVVVLARAGALARGP